MGQAESVPTTSSSCVGLGQRSFSSEKSQKIEDLIGYAKNNYQENPTEALAALMQALTLNSGKASADLAMDRLRNELGNDIADYIGSQHLRMERAMSIVQELLEDESTLLYENNQQDLLRQTMEDGSSLVCSKCRAVVSSSRWTQHQQYWCEANGVADDDTEEEDV